jgi:hypothetical protein
VQVKITKLTRGQAAALTEILDSEGHTATWFNVEDARSNYTGHCAVATDATIAAIRGALACLELYL